MPLTLKRLKSIQHTAKADGVEIDENRMKNWTEAEAKAFFESGGSQVPESEINKARDMFRGSSKKSSFIANTGMNKDQRMKSMHDLNNSKFGKSLTGEEMKAVDPDTGIEGTWVRPHIHYDPTEDPVPPPPPGMIPKDILAQPKPADDVTPMPVLKGGTKSTIMTRAVSGIYCAPPPPPETGGEKAAVVKQTSEDEVNVEIVEDMARAMPSDRQCQCAIM